MIPLPIDSLIPEVLASLEKHPSLVLQASPGSGKTTRVPPALLEASFLKPHQEILVLVPRRLAAKLAAYRVAEERGERVGERIGYQFRFEKALGPKTRLKFLTEGMLLRMMMSEPMLPKAGILILDEFHERHLHSDVALSYLRWLQLHRRPDLRILVMSATLETSPLSVYLGAAPVLQLEAPPYPIETIYLPSGKEVWMEQQVSHGVRHALEKLGNRPGDILIFLPGMAEIRRSEEKLKDWRRNDLLILPLHGELPREEQAMVFEKFSERKLILSTNVAESSLTIEGVSVVIDSGLHRQASFSWWSGVPSLKTRPISQASAAQRAGRAGRTGPGMALRLYSKADFEGRPAFDLPEIKRADLTQTVLELNSLPGISLQTFPWFERPGPGLLEAGVELLYYLGALERKQLDSRPTARGLRMSEFPLHPRLSRILVEGEGRGVYPEAARLVAMISEDCLKRLDILEETGGGIPENVRRLHSQLMGYGDRAQLSKKRSDPDALAQSILTGFPDRIARKRGVAGEERKGDLAKEYDLVFSAGGSGTVPAEGAILTHDLFTVLDVQERQGTGQKKAKVHVRSVCAIEAEWLLDLQPSLLEEKNDLYWDPASKRLWQRAQLAYGQIILDQTRRSPEAGDATTRVFLKEGLGVPPERLDSPDYHLDEFLQALSAVADREALEAALARRQLLQKYLPESGLAPLDSAGMKRILLEALRGVLSWEDFKGMDLVEKVFETLPPGLRSQMQTLLPSHLELARGRRGRIQYGIDQQPFLASRLQDFFGMREGPKIMNGRLPLTLHLLAPNQRAVQVTQDLKNFWEKIYPEIRPQLSRRYPRHPWPEDPLKPPQRASSEKR